MKKLYSSVLALMILLGLFSTVAYAWLALATVNNIENLSMQATSGNYLEMSLDGIKYSTRITGRQMLSQMKKLKFDNITSNDGINFNKSYTDNSSPTKNVDYMSIKIYFRTTSQYREVHLSDNVTRQNIDYDNTPKDATYIVSEGQMFKTDVKFLYDINNNINKYVERDEIKRYYGSDAMRLSIINNLTDESKIFDLSEDEHRGFGKPYGAIDYLNKTRFENNIAPQAPQTIYKLSEFSEDEPFAKTFDSKIITLERSDELIQGKRAYKGSITLNVWLEGWDADAFDGIYKDKLKMQFMFKAVMPTLPPKGGDAND